MLVPAAQAQMLGIAPLDDSKRSRCAGRRRTCGEWQPLRAGPPGKAPDETTCYDLTTPDRHRRATGLRVDNLIDALAYEAQAAGVGGAQVQALAASHATLTDVVQVLRLCILAYRTPPPERAAIVRQLDELRPPPAFAGTAVWTPRADAGTGRGRGTGAPGTASTGRCKKQLRRWRNDAAHLVSAVRLWPSAQGSRAADVDASTRPARAGRKTGTGRVRGARVRGAEGDGAGR